jgi:hypothetical protein
VIQEPEDRPSSSFVLLRWREGDAWSPTRTQRVSPTHPDLVRSASREGRVCRPSDHSASGSSFPSAPIAPTRARRAAAVGVGRGFVSAAEAEQLRGVGSRGGSHRERAGVASRPARRAGGLGGLDARRRRCG